MMRLARHLTSLAAVFGTGLCSVGANIRTESQATSTKSQIASRIAEQYPAAVSISSDGAHLLLRTAKWDSDELLVIDRNSGRTVAKTETKDTPLGISWSPDGARIAYLLAPGNSESYRLYVWNLSNHLVRQIDSPITNVAVQPPRWSPDSSQLAYMVGTAEDSAIWIVDLRQKAPPHLLAEHARPRTDFEWSPDGSQMALALSRGPGTLRVVSLSNGELSAQISIGTDRNSEIRDLWWAASGKSLAVTARISRNFTELQTVDLAMGHTRPCVSIGSNVASPRFAPDGQTIVFSAVYNAEQFLYSTSCDGSPPKLLGFESGTTRFLRFLKSGSAIAKDAAVFAALHTAPDEAPALYTISLQSGKTKLIYLPLRAEKLKSRSPRRVDIDSEGGSIPAVLWEDPTDSRGQRTVIVDVHGGPHLQSYARWEFLPSLLSSAGAAVVSPNYLGSSGYGYKYEESGTTSERVKQIVATCKYAKTLGGRSNRVILIGTSYGSHLAAAAAVADPQDVDGLLLISLVSTDSVHGFLNDPSFPIFCFHGENDPLPPDKAKNLLNAFFGSGGLRKWKTSPREGHVFRHVGSWAEIYSVVLDMVTASGPKGTQ